jgi:thioester reductase-like protein
MFTLTVCVFVRLVGSQSKYVAELLVRRVHSRGLPVRVYRPGTISGHSRTGFSNRNDFVNRLLCGMVQLGSYPREAASSEVNMCPADFVAKAIVGISLSSSLPADPSQTAPMVRRSPAWLQTRALLPVLI